MNRAFFAKLSKPTELAGKFFEEADSWLNGIDIGDYAFIRQKGNDIVELWKAEEWLSSTNPEHKKLQFSVVTTFAPAIRLAPQFSALKLFNVDLTTLIYVPRTMKGLCFYPLRLAFPNAIDIISDPVALNTYIRDEKNYRRVLVHDSAADVVPGSEDVQIYKENGEFELHATPFIDDRIIDSFKGGNYVYGKYDKGGPRGRFYKAVERGLKIIPRTEATLQGFYELFCAEFNSAMVSAKSTIVTMGATPHNNGEEEPAEDVIIEDFVDGNESVVIADNSDMIDPINKEVCDSKDVNEFLLFNTIFYGVPGCGKSHEINKRLHIGKNFETLDKALNPKFYKRILFHPEYSYSDFVGQIVPQTYGTNVTYEFRAGPFVEILASALDDPYNQYFLIIEEINRGNAPAIFGDIFQLLDLDDNGQSEYPIDNVDIVKELTKRTKKNIVKVYIPNNLTLFATMNTSDQNVFALDTAFKRRWRMVRIANTFNPSNRDPFLDEYIAGKPFTWREFAEALNNDILGRCNDGMIAEDKLLGTHFVKKGELKNLRAFAEKIFMYLWNDVVKYDKTQLFRSDLKTLDEVIYEFVDKDTNVFHADCSNMAKMYRDAVARAVAAVTITPTTTATTGGSITYATPAYDEIASTVSADDVDSATTPAVAADDNQE